VDDDPLRRDLRRLGVPQLPQRGHVRADALLGQQPHQSYVRERLRPVDDHRVRRAPTIRPRLRADRLLAIDDQRRVELLGQRAHTHPAHTQLAADNLGRIGKQFQHGVRILPVKQLLA
jgi:hypothetical protein